MQDSKKDLEREEVVDFAKIKKGGVKIDDISSRIIVKVNENHD